MDDLEPRAERQAVALELERRLLAVLGQPDQGLGRVEVQEHLQVRPPRHRRPAAQVVDHGRALDVRALGLLAEGPCARGGLGEGRRRGGDGRRRRQGRAGRVGPRVQGVERVVAFRHGPQELDGLGRREPQAVAAAPLAAHQSGEGHEAPVRELRVRVRAAERVVERIRAVLEHPPLPQRAEGRGLVDDARAVEEDLGRRRDDAVREAELLERDAERRDGFALARADPRAAEGREEGHGVLDGLGPGVGEDEDEAHVAP